MARASYTPLTLLRGPSFDSAEDEMERAFTPDDEDDEETTHLTPSRGVAERPIIEPIYTNQGAPAYDFERDYDIPPPGSPPATYSSSHPAAGNSNGIIPSPSSTVRLEPPNRVSRMSFFRRTVGAILPQYYTRLPTSDAESRRVHGSGVENDGVFANVLAKPARPATTEADENGDIYVVPEETQKDAPPSYAVAQADTVPPYWETTVLAPANGTDGLLIDGLPAGSVFSFLWNLLFSVSLQFVGFMLTYLLHTTHAAKYGSRAGLGITLIQYGFVSRTISPDIGADAGSGTDDYDSDGQVTNLLRRFLPRMYMSQGGGDASDTGMTHNTVMRDWLSFILMTVGWFLLLSSVLGYARTKRWEHSIRSSPSNSEERQHPVARPIQVSEPFEFVIPQQARRGQTLDRAQEAAAREREEALIHRSITDDQGKRGPEGDDNVSMHTTSSDTRSSTPSHTCASINVQTIDPEENDSTVLVSSSSEPQFHEHGSGSLITSGNEDSENLVVTFFPPLHAARSGWILDHLRRERVSSVLDVGCGEGGLMRALCNPAPFLCTQDQKRDLNVSQSQPGSNTHSSDTNVADDTITEADSLEIHISKLYGLDISPDALEECIQVTAPPLDPDPDSDEDNTDKATRHRLSVTLPRWEPLEVQLWLGSLAVYNPTFVDVDCIVATEVIEHLSPPALSAFAPTLLGLYQPRLLLLTTPNYTYNARFSAPNAPNTTRIAVGRAFLDPTGRTTRVFRHPDHKFEWIPEELTAWAYGAAALYGYDVHVGAVGQATEDDPWGRDTELGRATQTVLFRRKGCKTNIEKQKMNEIASRDEVEKHVLLKIWHHKPHRRAGRSKAAETILQAVASYMEGYYFEQGYTIWDLWVEISIAAACGGSLDVLIRTLEAAARSVSGDFSLITVGAKPTSWVVKFRGEKHHEAVSMQKSRKVWIDDNDTLYAEKDPYNLVEYTETDRDGTRVDEEAQDQQQSFPEEERQRIGDEDGIAGPTSYFGSWGSESSPSWAESGGWN